MEVAAGTYGDQSIEPDSTKTSTNDVTFRPATGAQVTTGGLTIRGSHVELRDLTLRGNWTVQPGADDITFRNLTVLGGIFILGGSNIAMIGGSVGPGVDFHPQFAPWPVGSPITNVLIDGVLFHDWTRTSADVHTECLQVAGTTNLTIRNSRFTNCAVFDLSFTEYNGSGKVTNLVLENNFFDVATSGGYYAINFSQMDGGLIRFNTSKQGWIVQGTNLRPMTWVGNIVPNVPWGCSSSVNYQYNITPGAQCGSTDRDVQPVFVNGGAFDLHLAPGSPGLDFVPLGTGGPATDIDGQPRPAGPAFDAGADELASSTTATPAPSPSATPTMANLWNDGNGGTCARQATAGAYSDATACGSIDAAWDAALPGDVVVLKKGQYGAQTVTGNKTSPGVRVYGEATPRPSAR